MCLFVFFPLELPWTTGAKPSYSKQKWSPAKCFSFITVGSEVFSLVLIVSFQLFTPGIGLPN